MKYALAASVQAIFALAAVLALSGCQHINVKADQARECGYFMGIDHASGKRFDPESALRPSPVPIVKILELTDEGELVDRCQWSDILYEIRGKSLVAPEIDRPKFVVFYVHGWKHNASENDEDLVKFTEFISKLNQSQEKRETKSDVVGVYVAWPGLSSDLPILQNLTFWGRKGAADRASAAANFSKLLSAVSSIRHQRNNREDFAVAIGHSFGARILFSAVSPLLLHDLQTKHPGKRGGAYSEIAGVVDLTILLNPAFEASRYSAFDASRRWQESFSSGQQPLMLTVSTSNDYATKVAFPAGQLIGFRWHQRERTTLGNYGEYVTHRLASASMAKNTDAGHPWYDEFCRENLCINRISGDPQPGNPFLVATTDSTVLDGHNGIWSASFQSWLVAFVDETVAKKRKLNGK